MDNIALGFLLERTSRMVKLNFHQLLKKEGVDVTPEQWVVIDILHYNKVLSQKEIADNSFKDAPSISRILKGLMLKGIIVKEIDGEDGRANKVRLTEGGERLHLKLYSKVVELRAKGIVGLSPDEIKSFLKTIDKVFNNYS